MRSGSDCTASKPLGFKRAVCAGALDSGDAPFEERQMATHAVEQDGNDDFGLSRLGRGLV